MLELLLALVLALGVPAGIGFAIGYATRALRADRPRDPRALTARYEEKNVE